MLFKQQKDHKRYHSQARKSFISMDMTFIEDNPFFPSYDPHLQGRKRCRKWGRRTASTAFSCLIYLHIKLFNLFQNLVADMFNLFDLWQLNQWNQLSHSNPCQISLRVKNPVVPPLSNRNSSRSCLPPCQSLDHLRKKSMLEEQISFWTSNFKVWTSGRYRNSSPNLF